MLLFSTSKAPSFFDTHRFFAFSGGQPLWSNVDCGAGEQELLRLLMRGAPGPQEPIRSNEATAAAQPAQPPRRRVRAPQTSYLRPEIDQSQQRVSSLQQQVDDLTRNNQQLRAGIHSCQQRIASVDARLLQHAASHPSAACQAGPILHTSHRPMTLADLPPPSAWTHELKQRLAAMRKEEVRLFMLQAYEDSRLLLRAAMQNPDFVPQVDAAVRKYVAFFSHQAQCNALVWAGMLGTNLATGESGSTPTSWFSGVAASLPLELIPAGFVGQLGHALRSFQAAVAGLQRRRNELQQEIASLTTQSMSLSHSPWSPSRGPSGSGPRMRPAPGPSLHAACSSTEDVICHVDEALGQLEETITGEYSAAVQLYHDAWQDVPPSLLAFMLAACIPFHLDVPQAMQALFDRLTLGAGVGPGRMPGRS